VHAGGQMLLSFPAANHDATASENADEFPIDGSKNYAVSFAWASTDGLARTWLESSCSAHCKNRSEASRTIRQICEKRPPWPTVKSAVRETFRYCCSTARTEPNRHPQAPLIKISVASSTDIPSTLVSTSNVCSPRHGAGIRGPLSYPEIMY
jgi:hypothetical protein